MMGVTLTPNSGAAQSRQPEELGMNINGVAIIGGGAPLTDPGNPFDAQLSK